MDDFFLLYAKLRLGTSRLVILSLFYVFILIYYLLCCSSLILRSRDIKTNPYSISSSGQCFSICHWNLNSITPHNYAKLSPLTAYNVVDTFHIICLSERCQVLKLHPMTHIWDYQVIICSVLINNKRGGVCSYYKSALPLRILNISNFNDCISFEVSITNKYLPLHPAL